MNEALFLYEMPNFDSKCMAVLHLQKKGMIQQKKSMRVLCFFLMASGHRAFIASILRVSRAGHASPHKSAAPIAPVEELPCRPHLLIET